MDRRQFIKMTGAAAAGFMLAGCDKETNGESAKQPNFLFILIDDMGWTDAGCFGSSFYETPNIDRLAAEGMKFTDGYAACPVCSPTRASIMSGKYPARMDTTDWFGAPQPEEVAALKSSKDTWWGVMKNYELLPAKYKEYLPLEEVTVAEALKQAGYGTFFAGKWHLGETEDLWPEYQGFDINKGGWLKGNPGKDYFSPYENPRLEDGPEGEHLPDRLANETVSFINASKDKPFLAYLSFYSVHTPLSTREDLIEKYKEKKKGMNIEEPIFKKDFSRDVRQVQEHAVYAGMVESMDMAVGKVLETLRANGLDDNTVVIFMSDNGGLSTSEGSPTSNVPLRCGKGWMYEGGIREPMLIKWPGVTKPGSVCSEPVISTDFYPTMLEMAGLPLMPDQHKDGVSLVPLLKGKKMDRGPIYWHYPHYGNQGGAPASAIRDGDWKLIKWYEGDRIELYNLKDDIGEQNNLVDAKPEITKKLSNKLNKWLKDMDAKFPTPNPDAKKK